MLQVWWSYRDHQSHPEQPSVVNVVSGEIVSDRCFSVIPLCFPRKTVVFVPVLVFHNGFSVIDHMTNPENHSAPFDALLIISYGGPEGPEEIRPFLENVWHGRGVSQEHFDVAVGKYLASGGCSPVNEECRSLLSGILRDIDDGLCPVDAFSEPQVNHVFDQVRKLPVYWGNLFWHPLLEDTIAGMVEEGIRRVIAFCTVPFGTEHSMRSYSHAIESAIEKAGIPDFVVQQTRLFYDHPLYISTVADRLMETLAMRVDWGNELPSSDDRPTILHRLPDAESHFVLFTAHSVPQSDTAMESYRSQLKQACSLVADLMQLRDFNITWDFAFQSCGSSRRTSQSRQSLWCGPDVTDYVKTIPERFPDRKTVIACPIGFMLENMELLYDLDLVLCKLCKSLGLNYERTFPVSGHRKIITMIRELVAEVYSPLVPRRCLG